MSEHYLGDGLFAHFDGYTIWLRAPREDGDHYVAMEPEVLAEFERWIKHLRKASAARSPSHPPSAVPTTAGDVAADLPEERVS